jgi:putative membrane protein
MKIHLIFAAALLCLPLPAYAMTDEECATMWKNADTNNDNVLSGSEAERYAAWIRVTNNQVGDSLDQDTFLEKCRADVFVERTVDEGAPLKGANSFTEGQAKDWVLSAGFSGVSALEKDSDGIWRGTATKDGKSMNVAVDYKGNVVAQ